MNATKELSLEELESVVGGNRYNNQIRKNTKAAKAGQRAYKGAKNISRSGGGGRRRRPRR